MIYILIMVLLGFAALIYMRFEAAFVEVRNVSFTKSNNCLKVLHLSDIHIPFLKVPLKKVKAVIDKEKPDFIILTGDYIIKPSQINAFLKFIREIKGNNKIFLCFGNHDYKAFNKNPEELELFERAISDEGITVLSNKSVCLEKDSRKYNIIGIEDIRHKRHDIEKAMEHCVKGCSANIAIAHNPDTVLEIPENSIDYLFCGHFHGGQIWAPFNLEFKLLRGEKLSKMGIHRGLYKINGINLYINRGLGNVFVPLRLFSRPEITVYHIG